MITLYRLLARGEQLEPGDEEVIGDKGFRGLDWHLIDGDVVTADAIVRRKIAEIPDRTEGRTATVTLPLQWVQLASDRDAFELVLLGRPLAIYARPPGGLWRWRIRGSWPEIHGDAATEDGARAAILAALMDAAVTS